MLTDQEANMAIDEIFNAPLVVDNVAENDSAPDEMATDPANVNEPAVPATDAATIDELFEAADPMSDMSADAIRDLYKDAYKELSNRYEEDVERTNTWRQINKLSDFATFDPHTRNRLSTFLTEGIRTHVTDEAEQDSLYAKWHPTLLKQLMQAESARVNNLPDVNPVNVGFGEANKLPNAKTTFDKQLANGKELLPIAAIMWYLAAGVNIGKCKEAWLQVRLLMEMAETNLTINDELKGDFGAQIAALRYVPKVFSAIQELLGKTADSIKIDDGESNRATYTYIQPVLVWNMLDDLLLIKAKIYDVQPSFDDDRLKKTRLLFSRTDPNRSRPNQGPRPNQGRPMRQSYGYQQPGQQQQQQQFQFGQGNRQENYMPY